MKKETAKTIMLVLFLLIIASFALGMFTSISAFAYIGIVLTIVLIIAYSVIWK